VKYRAHLEMDQAEEVTPTLLLDDPRCRIYHATWRQLRDIIIASGERIDGAIVDCPYSAKTR